LQRAIMHAWCCPHIPLLHASHSIMPQPLAFLRRSNKKCKSLYQNRLRPAKLAWTMAYRKAHKKDQVSGLQQEWSIGCMGFRGGLHGGCGGGLHAGMQGRPHGGGCLLPLYVTHGPPSLHSPSYS
jgi:hypothetical protein